MRALSIIAFALLLNGCTLIPEQSAERSGEPTSSRQEPTPAASGETESASRLAAAWQSLFDEEFEQANAGFAEVIGQTPMSSNLHRRALLGQALVYSDPDWDGRDLEQAAARLEQIPAEFGAGGASVVVFDWLLTQSVSRRVDLERSQAALESELAATRRRNRELVGELERARAEKAEVEQTVARLRELIMGEN